MNLLAAIAVHSPFPYQQEMLDCPFSIFAGGGGGGGKTMGKEFKILQHAQLYGALASVLVLRQFSRASAAEFERFVDEFLPSVGTVPDSVNRQDQVVVINQCKITFQHCEDLQTYRAVFSGRSWSMIVFDECQSWLDFSVPDAFMSRLRHPTIACITLWIANPGGRNYAAIVNRFIKPSRDLPRGTPFRCAELGGIWFVSLPSTVDDNPHIDTATYERALLAACRGNQTLYAQLRHGDFSAVAGSYFPISAPNFVQMPHLRFDPTVWTPVAGLDHGSTNPFAYILMMRATDTAQAPDRVVYPKGSFIAVGEVHSADPANNFTSAKGPVTVTDIGAQIHDAFDRWELDQPSAFVDDAVFAHMGGLSTIGQEYQRNKVRIQVAHKGRRTVSLGTLKEYIANAGDNTRVSPSFPMLFRDEPLEKKDAALFIDRARCKVVL